MRRGASGAVAHLLGRIWVYLVLFGVVWLVAGGLFYLIEAARYSLLDSFYWAIVTLGTVGYGDVVPTVPEAKYLASGVIVMQIFLLGYLIAVITAIVGEESQRRALGLYGTRLTNHVVVLGNSPVGSAAIRELLVQGQQVAVVCERAEEIPNLRTLGPESHLYVTYGPSAENEVLERVNLTAAHSVIICTSDDAANMIAALNVRAINARIRIVVSVGRPELRNTLRAAGVTYVASPSDLGGRLCASAAFEPEVANAIEDMTAADVQSDIREYLLPAGSPLVGLTFAEADTEVRKGTGALLVGYGRPDAAGEFRTLLNPPFGTRLQAGDAVILICTLENARRSEGWFGVEQGR